MSGWVKAEDFREVTNEEYYDVVQSVYDDSFICTRPEFNVTGHVMEMVCARNGVKIEWEKRNYVPDADWHKIYEECYSELRSEGEDMNGYSYGDSLMENEAAGCRISATSLYMRYCDYALDGLKNKH